MGSKEDKGLLHMWREETGSSATFLRVFELFLRGGVCTVHCLLFFLRGCTGVGMLRRMFGGLPEARVGE